MRRSFCFDPAPRLKRPLFRSAGTSSLGGSAQKLMTLRQENSHHLSITGF